MYCRSLSVWPWRPMSTAGWYIGSDRSYERWQPGYRYGWESAQRYQGRQWNDVENDLRSGLEVIEGRSEALGRFMGAYARLARLPQPEFGSVDVATWVGRIAALETRLEVSVRAGPAVLVTADGDQLDQLLINLVRNAADAALETGGAVEVGWRTAAGVLELTVEDEGPGLPDPGNLFVPFFTTKASGSGIGLVLSRQIAEAHGGSLTLENRAEGRGCVATLSLPLPNGVPAGRPGANA